MPINNLHETGIDPLRKALVIFDQRTMIADWRTVDAIDYLYGMRIAHRNDADFQRFISDIERIDHHIVVVQKGDFAGKNRGIPMSTVTLPSSSRRGTMIPVCVSTRISRLSVSPDIMDKADETARAIAALLDLAAIGIEDAITEIDIGLTRFFDQQNLVATDTKIPVSEKT
jgi:hypothetical protein